MELHPTKAMHLPQSSQVKDSTWAGKTGYNNLDFYGFNAQTLGGADQELIHLNRDASDYIQMQEFTNLRLHDSSTDAMTKFFEPPAAWANPADCGQWPCTGPKNTFMDFKGMKYFRTCTAGNAATLGCTEEQVKAGAEVEEEGLGEAFQLIPWIEGYSEMFDGCVSKKKEINGFYCKTKGLGILLWESLDPDSWDRSIQPVYYRFNE